MTVRITAVPRPGAPNSGFHPYFFSQRRGDTIWALPGLGPYAGSYENVRIFWFDTALAKRVLPRPFLRLAALLSLFLHALVTRRQNFFVHSFIFCLPVWAAGQPYCLTIHGSDAKYLGTPLGRFLARRAQGVFGIGFEYSGGGFEVTGVPNVFDYELLNRAEAGPGYDVLFVLRDAPVKNPQYPYRLFENTPPDTSLSIAVAGLVPDFLTGEEARAANASGTCRKRIDYLGRCSFEKVAGLMKSGRVLILPSHSEGVAKAMLEGLACGMHVVVSSRLRIPEEFSDVLIRADLEDWTAVLKVIERCKSDGFSRRNADFAASYLERAIRVLDDTYEEVCAQSRPLVPFSRARE